MLPLTSLLQGLSGTRTENNPQKQFGNREGEGKLNTLSTWLKSVRVMSLATAKRLQMLQRPFGFYPLRYATVTFNSFHKYQPRILSHKDGPTLHMFRNAKPPSSKRGEKSSQQKRPCTIFILRHILFQRKQLFIRYLTSRCISIRTVTLHIYTLSSPKVR